MLPESPRIAKRTENGIAQTITSRATQHVISSSRAINHSGTHNRRASSLICYAALRGDNASFLWLPGGAASLTGPVTTGPYEQ